MHVKNDHYNLKQPMKRLSGHWIALGVMAFLLASAQPVLAPEIGHCSHCLRKIGLYQAHLKVEVQQLKEGLKLTADNPACPDCVRKMQDLTGSLTREVSNVKINYRIPNNKEGLKVSSKMSANVKRLKQAIKALGEAKDERSARSALARISTTLNALERNRKEAP